MSSDGRSAATTENIEPVERGVAMLLDLLRSRERAMKHEQVELTPNVLSGFQVILPRANYRPKCVPLAPIS